MKQLCKGVNYKAYLAFLMAMMVQTALWAQDSGGGNSESSTSVTRTQTTSTNWYASPWVWVVGVAVFILLLIALLRGSSSKTVAGRTDRVTVTKTTDTDLT